MYFELKQEVFDRLKAICDETFAKKEELTVQDMAIKLMDMQGLIMHCPYHHYILPAALLTQAAISCGKTKEEYEEWMAKAEERAKTVPAGFCGECGTCGSAVGVGIFISIYTGATPKSEEIWQWANEGTGKCLLKIASLIGPRCCKRTTFLALAEGTPYINEKCGTALKSDNELKCKYHGKNAECIEDKCPYYEED